MEAMMMESSENRIDNLIDKLTSYLIDRTKKHEESTMICLTRDEIRMLRNSLNAMEIMNRLKDDGR